MAARSGVVASTLRPPGISVVSFTTPAASSYTVYTSSATPRRTFDYQVSLDSNTELPAQYTATLRRVSDNATLGTPQTYTGLTSTGNQTARQFTNITPDQTNAIAVRLDVTVTDAYGQTKSVSSSNLNMPAVLTTYTNVAKTYNTGFQNESFLGDLNTYGTNRTSGTVSGSAANLVDGNGSTRVTISGMTSTEYAEFWAAFQWTEFALRDWLGFPETLVASNANAAGLVDDSMTVTRIETRYRLNARRRTFLFYYDVVGEVFRTSNSTGSLGNINLNTFDNRAYQDDHVANSTDQPNIDEIGWNEFTNDFTGSMSAGDFLTIKYYRWNVSLLQTGTTSPSITDIQCRVSGGYTEREPRYQ